jgi:outer membrane receptor protein involved in Fe transport
LPAAAFAEGLGAAPECEPEQGCVEVTAARLAGRRAEADRGVDVVARERLEELQIHSLPEAVEAAEGVYPQMTNPGAGSPILRGQIGPQNLILVDGVRFHTTAFRTGPNQYLATLSPWAVERLEVLRGPSSVLYGNGAMGGVVQLLTREARADTGAFAWGGEARATFASADLGKGGMFELDGSGAGLGLLAGGGYLHHASLRTGGGGAQPLSDHHAGHWHTRARVALGAGLTLQGAYLGGALRGVGRADQAGRGDVRFYDNDDHLAYLRLVWAGAGPVEEARLTLAYHRAQERVERYTCATASGRVAELEACLELEESQLRSRRQYADTTDVLGLDAVSRLGFLDGRVRTTWGFELYQEWIASSLERADASGGWAFAPAGRGNFSDGSRALGLGAFGHVRLTLLEAGERGALRFGAGGRVSHASAHAPGVPGLGDVDHAHTGLVGSLGLQFILPARLVFFFNFMQGFRAPDLQETTVLGDTGQKFEIPNASLGPERNHTFELGLRLFGDPLEFEVVFYDSLYQDMIDVRRTTWQGQAEVDGKPVVERWNGARGEILGLEARAGLRLGRLRLGAEAVWSRGDVEDATGARTPARRIPPPFGAFELRYTDPDRVWFVEAWLAWALGQDRLHPLDREDPRICETAPLSGVLQADCQGTPGWWTLGLRGGARLTSWLKLHAQLTNLLDRRYRLHGSGVDAPGVDLRLTLGASF